MKILDGVDRDILRLLQDNAKLTIKEVANQLGMTTTPVYERIKRMEEAGYIERYVALLNQDKLLFNLSAYCQVSLVSNTPGKLQLFEQAVGKMDEVVECHRIAGAFDYLLKVIVSDMKEFEAFLVEKLSAQEIVGQVHTSFVMSSSKQTTSLPL